ALVRLCAFADRVDRRDLVEVADAVGEAGVGVVGDGPQRRQECLGAAAGGAVDAVAGDRRAAVRGRGGPANADGGVAGGRAREGGRAGDGRGGGRGGASLGRERALADRVHGRDLVEVGQAGGQPGVGEAADVAERRQEHLAAAAGGAVDLVV